MNMYENSDFIEKEQPELSEETKRLISLYQQNPTEENYRNLRAKVIEDYNAVVERKETKLDELKPKPRESRAARQSLRKWKNWCRISTSPIGPHQQQHASLYRSAPPGVENRGSAPGMSTFPSWGLERPFM